MAQVTDWIEANGVVLRYRFDDGGDRTLVLIHEMGGTLENWEAVIPLLAPGYRVLTYDMRGAGLSEKISGTASLDDLADDLAALLDRLGVGGKVVVAGVAVGGAIAIRFANRHAGRVRGIVPMAPAVGVGAERRPGSLQRADVLETEGVRSTLSEALERLYPEEIRSQGLDIERYLWRYFTNDARSLAALNRMVAELDMEAEFGSVAVPTLVVCGELDAARPLSAVEPVALAIPGATLQVLRTSHFMSVQTPALVAGALNRFLLQLDSGEPSNAD